MWLACDDGRLVELGEGVTRIGRSLLADLRFEDPTVSRRHALVVRRDDALLILDDRSTNGVYVNGERVAEHRLEAGDVVTVGRHDLHVHAQRPPQPPHGREAQGEPDAARARA